MKPHAFCDRITRRSALRWGVCGGVGLSLADYLCLAETRSPAVRPRADACIFLHLHGGPAHLDTLDMKPDGPVDERGEFKPIQTSLPGLVACEHLPRLARQIHEFALVRGISHSVGDHPAGNQYLYSGNKPTPAVPHPAMGSVLSLERPVDPTLPAFVAIPTSEMNPGYLGVGYGAFKTTTVPKAGKPFEVRGLSLPEGLTLDRLRDRNRLLDDLDQTFRQADANSALVDGLDRFGQQAREMILSPNARVAFDISREPASVARLFAEDDLSQSLLLAARLVEHGVRFVTLTHISWDTHQDNFKLLKEKLCPQLDAGLTALVAALRLKGLLDRTLVVASGEFGRTPTVNKNAGRDHWPRTMWTLLAGGGVRPGNLIGGTDAKGHGPDDATHLKPDDLAASIYHALGVDPLKEYHTRTGRPVILLQHGQVIEGLF